MCTALAEFSQLKGAFLPLPAHGKGFPKLCDAARRALWCFVPYKQHWCEESFNSAARLGKYLGLWEGMLSPNIHEEFESAFKFDLVLLQTELSRVAHINTWARQMLGLDVGWVAIWEGISSTRVVEGWSECCLPRSQVGVAAEGCGKGWSDGRVGSGESWDLG